VSPGAYAAAEAALVFSFDQALSIATLNAGHLIREVERLGPGSELQFLELSWNFIASDSGQVERVLVTVRDTTVLRRLKQMAGKKEREVDMIVQVLDCGVEATRAFCLNCHQLLADNRAAVDLEMSEQRLAAGFRNLHSLKGNARLHGLSHLVDCLHSAEDAYDEARRGPPSRIDGQQLLQQLGAIEAMLAEYESVCEQRLSAVSSRPQDPNEAVLRDLRRLVDAASAGEGSHDLMRELRGLLERLEPTSVARLVEETREMLPSLAAELGKPAPRVLTQLAEAQLAGDWTGLVKDVLVQCFRNSLYHGIEMPEARELAGKPARGTIQVSVRSCHDAFELHISDDGRGLALEKLRERAGQRALSDEAVAEQIFVSGVSTADTVDRVAGRGVGLDIVRASVQARGGDALVRFSGEEQQGYRPFVLVILLPCGAVASSGGERRAEPLEVGAPRAGSGVAAA
jgi:HPt (histidine-containing phosphotransfer) domain-containing protein